MNTPPFFLLAYDSSLLRRRIGCCCQSECDFLGGYYQHDAVSCQEADCLNAICQLSVFTKKYIPDQWYRLIIAPFVPVGVVHHLVFLLAQLSLGVPLERVRERVCVCECVSVRVRECVSV